MSWMSTLRTSAEDFGTLAKNNSSTASTAFAGKHNACCFPVAAAALEDLHWRSTRTSLTYAWACVRFQYGDDEACEGDVARQDDMSAHDMTRSAIASEPPLLIDCTDTQGVLHQVSVSVSGKNQSLSPNSGQVAEDGTQSPRGVLDSEPDQQPPAGCLMLPQPQNDPLGQQTRSASSRLDQPQGAQVQYQLAGNDRAPLAVGVQVQDQPSGNDLTPRAGEASSSTATVDAQLTPSISRDDVAEMQDAARDDDAPMPDAPTVHDIATYTLLRTRIQPPAPADDEQDLFGREEALRMDTHGLPVV